MKADEIRQEIRKREGKIGSLSQAEIQISQGVLLFLKLTHWSGQTILKKSDLEKMGVDIEKIPDGLVRLGFKYLVPKEEIDKFKSLAGRIRYRVIELSMRYPLAPSESVRFVPFSLVPELEDKLSSLKKEWDAKVSDFLGRYDDYRTRLIEKYPHLRDVLEEQVPTMEFISGKFAFSWSYMDAVPLSLKSINRRRAVRFAVKELEILREHENRINQMMREYEDRVHSELEEALLQMKIEYKKQIIATINDFIQRMEKFILMEDTVHGPSVNYTFQKISEKINALEKFNIFGDREISKRLRELKKMVDQGTVKYEELPSGVRKIMQHLETSLEEDLQKLPKLVRVKGVGVRKIVINKEVENG